MARLLSYTIPTAGQSSYALDLMPYYVRGLFDVVRTIWIDNESNAADFSVTTSVINQKVVCPAGSQGYFPLLQPSPAVLTFQTTGAVDVDIALYDLPMPMLVYKTVPVSLNDLLLITGAPIALAMGGGVILLAE